jgi:hypothetical protein
MATEGWICIARKITEWEWYSDPNVFRLFLHLLLKANFRDNRWQGVLILRGQMLASRGTISEQIGLTIKQIRVAEAKLLSCGAIEVKGASRFTMYTVVKYDDYQVAAAEEASKGQAKGKPRASKGQHLNKDNNANNENNNSIPLPLPDWLPLQMWEDYLAMREAKGAKATEKAKILIIAKLDSWRAKGHDPSQILSKSITSNWTDIYEPKGNNNADHRPNNGRDPHQHRYEPPGKRTWASEGDRLTAKYLAEEAGHHEVAVGRDAEPGLFIAEAVWQDQG